MAKQPATETVIDLDEGFVPQQAGALERMRAAGPTGPVVPAGPDVVVDEDPAAAAVVDEDADESGKLPKRAVRHPDGTIELPLREPRSLQVRSSSRGLREETYDRLTFHRLTGADLRAIAAASKETQPVVMLARSARIRQPIMNALFDAMDAADLADAAECVNCFFGSGPTTGR
ncbi:phage tail assembly protein [Rhodoplanes sp. TEM]|uniref:Phage tail assembly protein n=1 Tax=Rhodoplanes tepidamans TaxID=200616 RepID=A0ABT5JEC9_RHOTP|nr:MULTISPECIES: phage tail assembly protein [Rhodoplanes]MDC7787964.1 phage tail assembly protein [Rhodoplanes tepidamans]MDC7984804.1 phage tail assembly protein [Rhodoplanes sp. TEM]MDQ0358393.1 hypothetical protein [Rhodoplanes tepidamans]